MKKLTPITVIGTFLGTLSILYYALCGILRSFTISGLWIWLGFGLIMYFGLIWKIAAEPKVKRLKAYIPIKRICLTVFSLFILVFLAFEGILIGEWIHGHTTSDEKPDAIFVLGATVEYDTPGDSLKKRIDTAYEYAKDDPDVLIIACGGLGEGDVITEADCIRSELVRMGISSDRIITETDSTSTAENFEYGAKHLPDDAECIGIVTSGFHQLRAGRICHTAMKKADIDVTVIPVSADDVSFFLPYSAVREFAAFVKDYSRGNIVF